MRPHNKPNETFLSKITHSFRFLVLIASALCYSCSFLYPFYCAWLIFLFPIPLILFFLAKKTWLCVVASGFLWGLVAYGLHYSWFYVLLREKSYAAPLVAMGVYALIVFYAAMTSSLWFLGVKGLQKMVSTIFAFLIATIGYFFLLEYGMFWFLGIGYPFLNPFIPLMRYEWCRIVFSGLLALCGVVDLYRPPTLHYMPEQRSVCVMSAGDETYRFLYLKPCKNDSSIGAAQELYTNLAEVLCNKSCNATQTFIVGPETTFPFACNKHLSFIDLWTRGLPAKTSLLFGGVRLEKKEKERRYQTIYWLQEGLIMQLYDKTHRVPFVEKLPRFWKNIGWTRSLFLEPDTLLMSKGKNDKTIFSISQHFSIRPILCSELFFKSIGSLGVRSSTQTTLLVACVNNDWFCPYFRQLQLLTARWRISFLGKDLLFVGHEDERGQV